MAPDLKSLLLFARMKHGSELYLTADGPIEILVDSRRSPLDFPPIEFAELDALLRQYLDEREHSELKSKGVISSIFELDDVGLVRARIADRAITFFLPTAKAPFRNATANSRVQAGIDRMLQALNTPLFETPRLRQLLNTKIVSDTFFFSRLFPLPFLLLGLVVLYLSSSNLILAHASMNWPSTLGTIQLSTVKASKTFSGRSTTTYSADITYGFFVNGVSFEGQRVDFGSAGSYGSGDRSYAEDIVNAYPPGLDVRVHYDPENPEESVLEPGITFYSGLGLLAGLAFLAVGLVTAIFLPKLMRRRYPRII